MPIPFVLPFLIGFGSLVISYMLLPKEKPEAPPSLEDFDLPTADAGRARPVLQGSSTITGLNVLSTHDKEIYNRDANAGKKSS